MAMQMKGRVEEFKPFIPLIQGLRNPGMRIRHWDLLSNELGFSVQPKVFHSIRDFDNRSLILVMENCLSCVLFALLFVNRLP